MLLAARGAREAAGGIATVDDADEVRQLKRQAARVNIEALAIAAVAAAVTMLARNLFGA